LASIPATLRIERPTVKRAFTLVGLLPRSPSDAITAGAITG